MTGSRTNVTMGAAVLLGALVALPGLASASSCQWYGATALRQQQENERLKCGFNNADEWHSDIARHTAWCNSVGPDVWKAAARARDKMLDDCAKK